MKEESWHPWARSSDQVFTRQIRFRRWRFFLAGMALLGMTKFASGALGQARPVNDNFANAIALVGTNVEVTGSNVNATKEAGEPYHAGYLGGKSVWWYWQAPAVGSVTISTEGSTSTIDGGALDTLLGVYAGTSVAGLTDAASNDDGPNDVTSLVTFQTSSGTIYRIAVDGYSYDTMADADCGNIVLSLNFAEGLPAAPPWSLPSIDGTTISSTNLSGRVVVLNFWATWCNPCVGEIPDLIQLQQNYGPDGLTVVGISVDQTSDGINPPTAVVGSFVASEGMNYPVVMASPLGYGVESAYGGIPYIPNTFIIDRQNHIAQSFVGSQSYAAFERAVLPCLYANLTVNLTVANGQARVSWPATQAAFVVESATNLSSGVWRTESATIQPDGSNQFIVLPVVPSTTFFRLRH